MIKSNEIVSTKETAAVQVELLVLTRVATGLVLESSGTIKSTRNGSTSPHSL